YADARDLHRCPTRRSSDLGPPKRETPAPGRGKPALPARRWGSPSADEDGPSRPPLHKSLPGLVPQGRIRSVWDFQESGLIRWWRSEEHTSELQSRENLVCR